MHCLLVTGGERYVKTRILLTYYPHIPVMALQTDSTVVGQALIVNGTVNIRSADGVSQVVKPNSPIHLDDQIDTGGDGAVSIRTLAGLQGGLGPTYVEPIHGPNDPSPHVPAGTIYGVGKASA